MFIYLGFRRKVVTGRPRQASRSGNLARPASRRNAQPYQCSPRLRPKLPPKAVEQCKSIATRGIMVGWNIKGKNPSKQQEFDWKTAIVGGPVHCPCHQTSSFATSPDVPANDALTALCFQQQNPTRQQALQGLQGAKGARSKYATPIGGSFPNFPIRKFQLQAQQTHHKAYTTINNGKKEYHSPGD